LSGLIQASGFQPDIVIAIGRGGYVPARLLCDALDIMALTSIKIEHYLSGSNKQTEAVIRYPLCMDIRDQRVLIVDDVNDSGDTLQLAAEHVLTFQPQEVRTAVLHDKRVTRYPVDYFAKRVIKWRWLIYPWAIHEDLKAFITRLHPPPKSLTEIQQQLAEQYKIKISLKRLRETIS
jgi:hypoxanthine phosphoribosyltransferase